MSITTIRKIATQVRHWAEELAVANTYDFFPNLSGLCAIASAELWDRLTAGGAEARIVANELYGEGHCFVMIDDIMIDVTATQFGQQKIVVGKWRCNDICRYWEIHYVFNTPQDLLSWQIEGKWPDEQLAKVV
jgi:hypothetical protein